MYGQRLLSKGPCLLKKQPPFFGGLIFSRTPQPISFMQIRSPASLHTRSREPMRIFLFLICSWEYWIIMTGFKLPGQTVNVTSSYVNPINGEPSIAFCNKIALNRLMTGRISRSLQRRPGRTALSANRFSGLHSMTKSVSLSEQRPNPLSRRMIIPI